MKHIKFIFFSVLSVAVFAACNKEEAFDPDRYIYGWGEEDVVKNDIDRWLDEAFVEPYNIRIFYKWSRNELESINYNLTPIEEDLVIPVARMFKECWIEPVEDATHENFVRELSPKTFVLVGSYKYNSNGTTVNGEAEGGRKIVLYRMNTFAPNRDRVTAVLKTVFHEYFHIFHQTKKQPLEFEKITAEYYISNWETGGEAQALQQGFLSAYCRKSQYEDFVDHAALIVVRGLEWYNDKLAEAQSYYDDGTVSENPADKIRQKTEIITAWFSEEWGVDFYDTEMLVDGQPEIVKKGLITLTQEAITNYIESYN